MFLPWQLGHPRDRRDTERTEPLRVFWPRWWVVETPRWWGLLMLGVIPKSPITGLVQGKIYRKPWFLPSNIGLSCKFSHHPILWTPNFRLVDYYSVNILPGTDDWSHAKCWSTAWNLKKLSFQSSMCFLLFKAKGLVQKHGKMRKTRRFRPTARDE